MKISLISLPKNLRGGNILKALFKSPPITHLWLAAILSEKGHEADILDALALEMGIDAIVAHVKKEKPNIVGFTVFTNGCDDVFFAAERIREAVPGTLVAVGGYHVNSLPEDFQKECIDFIFIGEGEYSILELMDRLDSGNDSKEDIPGLMYLDEADKTWKRNAAAPFRQDFDSQPPMPYDKILANTYNTWWTTIDHRTQKFMATVSGKGCPMGCSFCDITKTEGPKYRAMSADRVLVELEHMRAMGITHVEFRDPFFTANTPRLEAIAQGIIDKKIDIEWGCSSTIRKIKNREQLRLLYRSGCRFLFFGVESGNREILHREKRVTPEIVQDVVKMVQQEKIQAHCSFIFGLQGETQETMDETLDLSLKLNPDSASYSIAIPYPGTALYDLYDQSGYLTTYEWKYYGGEEPVFETPTLSKEALKTMLEKAHRRFYFRPRYVLKRLKRIRTRRELANHVSIATRMLVDVTSYKR